MRSWVDGQAKPIALSSFPLPLLATFTHVSSACAAVALAAATPDCLLKNLNASGEPLVDCVNLLQGVVAIGDINSDRGSIDR